MKKPFLVAALTLILLTGCLNTQFDNPQTVSIGEVQGCSHESPLNGKPVHNIEGVVTHKFTNGFTMQSLSGDSSDCSSDAVFVTTGEYPKVMPGQLVSVDGIVTEYTAGNFEDHNLSRTEIHQPEILVLNKNVEFPAPIIIGESLNHVPINWIKQSKDFDINNNGLDYYESLEFMLVEVENGIVVGPKNDYNEFVVLPEKFIDLNTISMQGALLNSGGDENPEKIMVDAASSFTQKVNLGDGIANLIIGVMDYSYGNFKIWTITDPVVKQRSTKTKDVEIGENSLTVATYNLENFSRFDDSARIRQIGCQIVKDLYSPDILVLNEVLDDSGTQDDGVVTSQKTLDLLINSIANCGGPKYAYSDNPPNNNEDGGIAGGNIRTCLIYRQDDDIKLDKPKSIIEGLIYKDNVFIIRTNPLRLFSDNENFLGTRKPTIWLFTWKGEQFVIFGTHLVSQSANTPDWGNLHPIEKPDQIKREKQMGLINNYLIKLDQMNIKNNTIILGDFNEYSWSNTIKVIRQNQRLVFLKSNNDAEDFSYIHEGNAFQFDYIVVSQNLGTRIKQFLYPHINTINSSNSQVSEHDPVLVEISN
jgi:uncharacterized protein